jgi:ABC-type transport system involved in cytochrome c biogenesis permease component
MRRPRLLRWFPAEWQLGPLLRLETVRLARCTRVHWLRVGYSVALLAALALAYWRSFPTLSAGEILTGAGGVLALNDQAAFAERFVDSLFLVQFLAIILLTPIYCGSAITEERERGSLDLLLSAPLADGEILIFKMLSRTLLLIGLLIGTVPFIAVVFALGGVSWSSILWRLTGNAAVLLCLALLAVMMSARGRRTLTTVYLVYASILPFGMQIYLVADQDPTYLFLLLFIGFVYFLPYLRGAAHERQSFEPLPVDPSGNWWKKERGTAPVGEAALWWKEMHWIAAPQHHPVFWGMATLAYVIPLLLGLLIFLPGVAEGRSFQVAGVSYRWFAILWACCWRR